jgi:hypothetical protein
VTFKYTLNDPRYN